MLEDGPLRRFRALLIKHEGLRTSPYRDTVGKLTIGVGRNLDDVGVSEFEAMVMLSSDIGRVQRECLGFGWFKSISVPRQDVVMSMVFNMGMTRFNGFKRMIQALACQDYARAAKEMLDSDWAKSQVPLRAAELAHMMESGSYPLEGP